MAHGGQQPQSLAPGRRVRNASPTRTCRITSGIVGFILCENGTCSSERGHGRLRRALAGPPSTRPTGPARGHPRLRMDTGVFPVYGQCDWRCFEDMLLFILI